MCSGHTSCAHLHPYKPSSFLLWTLSFSCAPHPPCSLYLVSLWSALRVQFLQASTLQCQASQMVIYNPIPDQWLSVPTCFLRAGLFQEHNPTQEIPAWFNQQ